MIGKVVQNQVSKNHVLNKKQPSFQGKYAFLTNFKSARIDSKRNNLDFSLHLKGRITTKGKIKFCNADFCTVTKIKAKEIQNKELTATFHPEMPKVILDIVKNKLEKNQDALVILKQIDSTGKTIWLNTHLRPDNSAKLNIACHLSANATSDKTIQIIEKIYDTVFLLENHVSYDIAKKYFDGLLEMEYGNYDGFIINAVQ